MSTPTEDFYNDICAQIELVRKEAKKQDKKLSLYCAAPDASPFKVYQMALKESGALICYGIDAKKKEACLCMNVFSISYLIRIEPKAANELELEIKGFGE